MNANGQTVTAETAEQIQIEVVELTRNAKPKHSTETHRIRNQGFKTSSFQSSPLSRKIDARRKNGFVSPSTNESKSQPNPRLEIEKDPDADFQGSDRKTNVGTERYLKDELVFCLR